MQGNHIGHHLVMRLVDDRVIAPDPAARRALAKAVLRMGESRGLLAFGAADTHLHILTLADRQTAGALAQAIAVALHAALDLRVPFEPTRFRAVQDQRHLFNAFGYVQTNAFNHGVVDPAWSEACSLHDLLGLRVGGAWLGGRVTRHLPRVGRSDLATMLGTPGLPLRAEVDVGARLIEAAAAAVCLPDLVGRSDAAVEARRTVVALADRSVRCERLAELLGTSERGVRKLRAHPPAPDVLEAVQRQVAWRATINPRVPSPPVRETRVAIA